MGHEILMSKYIKMDGTRKTYEQLRIEYIKASEVIRCDINKEEDIFRMLDMALLCIATMTNDMAFYKINREKVLSYICEYKTE